MNKTVVISTEKRFKLFEGKIKKIVNAILTILKKDKKIVEIYLLGDKKMKSLNKKFRNKNKSTNILSFVEPKNFPHPELRGGNNFKKRFLGEIYLNIDKTREFSGSKQHLKLKLEMLLAHGLLHLLGYIHNTKNDRIKMEQKEKFISRNLKVG